MGNAQKKYEHTPAECRIRGLIAGMPFGALMQIAKAGNVVGQQAGAQTPITLEQIADYLEALRSFLKEHSAEVTQLEKDFEKLAVERAAARRFFGVEE